MAKFIQVPLMSAGSFIYVNIDLVRTIVPGNSNTCTVVFDDGHKVPLGCPAAVLLQSTAGK